VNNESERILIYFKCGKHKQAPCAEITAQEIHKTTILEPKAFEIKSTSSNNKPLRAIKMLNLLTAPETQISTLNFNDHISVDSLIQS